MKLRSEFRCPELAQHGSGGARGREELVPSLAVVHHPGTSRKKCCRVPGLWSLVPGPWFAVPGSGHGAEQRKAHREDRNQAMLLGVPQSVPTAQGSQCVPLTRLQVVLMEYLLNHHKQPRKLRFGDIK